jgi:hypothetical protein
MDQAADDLNEENRQLLLCMASSGDDLTRPRDIDFSVVFGERNSAETFAADIGRLGYRASVEKSDSGAEHPWDVTVVRHMVPICEAITEFELLLQAKGSALGGRNDGWGCFEQGPSNQR